MTNTSQLFSLNWSDVGKGFIVAVFSAIITALAALINVPGFSFGSVNWQSLLGVGLIAGISYLTKNFLSDSQGKFLGTIG